MGERKNDGERSGGQSTGAPSLSWRRARARARERERERDLAAEKRERCFVSPSCSRDRQWQQQSELGGREGRGGEVARVFTDGAGRAACRCSRLPAGDSRCSTP